MAGNKRLLNFSAGPCQLPLEVMEEVQREVFNFRGWGLSVMEMSHRGGHFKKVLAEAQQAATKFLAIPPSHCLLFMPGGATAQFAAEPLNLLSPQNTKADYAITGYWSKYALTEAQKFADVRAVTDASRRGFTEIDPIDSWDLNPQASYVHYCDNETIHGLEFRSTPALRMGAPERLVVADLASNIGTRRIDWSNIDVAYAGAQKNIGIAGVTLVALNREILGRESLSCPSVLSYKKTFDADSCLNTPPCFNIYVMGVTLQHLAKMGDLDFWDRECTEKSDAVYRRCDASEGFFVAPVKPLFRSRVAVRFSIAANENAAEIELKERRKREDGEEDVERRGGEQTPEMADENNVLEEARQKDKELTKTFLEEAEREGMICLNGHRSLGGLRACLYSGVSRQHVEQLVNFMKEFQEEHAPV